MERFLSWWKTEKRYVTGLKMLLMGLLPVVACLIYCALQGRGIGEVYLPGSEWNDELFYFKQVESMVEYGYPRGYFGFNESHALKLSFAAWSPVLVFPWVLWGMIFGWNLMSPIICNILLMTLAMVIFVWLVRPTWKQLGLLTLLFFLFTPFVRYMLSGMPEVICFSMLIIFYSVAVSYLRRGTWGKLAWLFMLSGLLTLMRPYMLLFLLLPVCFWIARSKWKGVIGSVAVLGVILGIYALIKHYLGAEYFAPLFFTDWVTAFFEQGLVGGIKYFFGKLYWNGKDFLHHMQQALRSGLASGAFFWGYLTVMAVLIYQSVADFFRLRRWNRHTVLAEGEGLGESAAQPIEKQGDNLAQQAVNSGSCDQERNSGFRETEKEIASLKHQLIIEAHMAISFVGMLFALLLMYKLTEGSKHLLTFIAVGVFVISLLRTRFYKKTVLTGAVFAWFYIHMALDPYDYQVPFVETSREAQVQEWQQVYAQELEMDLEKVPSYDNAIIWTFSDKVEGKSENLKWQLLYGLPEGFGISCCMPAYVQEHLTELQCRYIATPQGGEIDAMCREAGYREIARDVDMAVYERY